MVTSSEREHSVTEDFQRLLLAFRSLPPAYNARTFMEVSGYPHYENVCSNILSFYFDPTAEHGLRDLLLSAFLNIASRAEIEVPNEVSICREFEAEDQKRIDIVIDCEPFVLGIENKIFHWEANDFGNYGRVLDRIGRNKAVIKAVLCLKADANQAAPGGGFARYTYEQLWNQTRKMIGPYLLQANPKWVTFLLDFISTTTNLTGPSMELKQSDRFFIENEREIDRLVAERNAFLDRLHQKATDLLSIVSNISEVKLLCNPPWIYNKNGLVLDFLVENINAISFDLYIRPSGWQLQLFGRDSKSKNRLVAMLEHPSLVALGGNHAPIVNERHIVQDWGIHTDLCEISNDLRSWMQALASAAEMTL